jgi:lipopolysaccharide/colanic/teichoic acid biosynthesis glycosyltransferase
MILTKLFAAARRLLGRPAPRELQDLLSPKQMRKILARERARADRTGDRFAVVTFAQNTREPSAGFWERLVKLLEERLRCTDEVGWLEDGQLCMVLAGSGAEGARKVVSDITQALGEVSALCCTICVYPADGSPHEHGHQTNGKVARETASVEPLFVQSLPLWKRALDVTGALVGLVLLAPLFAVVAVAIKLTSRGPVFFGQMRSGRGGKPFKMWKFRSMVADAEARKKELQALNEQDGAAFKIKNDPRVTRVGRFLRSTSIDELPQLWNVLRGEMSLVGPRPLPCSETASCAGWQRQRLDATPGLTCIWQVYGRCRVSFADWVRMDVRYIRSRSLWQDVKLLLLTLPVVLLRRGAH